MKKAGRNTIDREAITETMSIRLSKTELDRISKIAKDLDLPKTRFMRNLLLSSLDDAEKLHKLGVLKGAKKLLDFKGRLLNKENYPSLGSSLIFLK